MFELSSLTDEQRAVAKAITIEQSNVIVNAVAGSGKTRTALTTAKAWLEQKHTAGMHVLLVAYNKRLEQDMSAQKDENVPAVVRRRIDIRTIHGFGHTYFGGTGLTKDDHLFLWTKGRKPVRQPLPRYGLVIIDEAQDITPILYSFLHYVMSLLPSRPQLLILGDPFQLLYGHKLANIKYLVNAEEQFGDVVRVAPFLNIKLSVCFRITHEMARWINVNLNPNNLHRAYPDWFSLHGERLAAWWGDGIHAYEGRAPAPNSVVYFRRDKYGETWLGGAEVPIHDVLARYNVEDSALISPSITQNIWSPVRSVTNALDYIDGEKCAWVIDGGDAGEVNIAEVRRNKQLASTIHRFKGRERDAIVLLGLDSFSERRNEDNPLALFNMFYVGATRARKLLLIVQWNESPYCTLRTSTGLGENKFEPVCCNVTNLLKHCSFDKVICSESRTCLTTEHVFSVPAKPLDFMDYIVGGAHHGKQLRTLENVSSVIGLSLEVRLQLLLDEGKLLVPDVWKEDAKDSNFPYSLLAFIMSLEAEAAHKSTYSWSELLKIATAHITLRDLYYVRWRQTDNFHKWHVVRESDKLDQAMENLITFLYELFCNRKSGVMSPSSTVNAKEKLAALKDLRRSGRLVMHMAKEIDMSDNPLFVKRLGGALEGEFHVILLPPSAVSPENSGYGVNEGVDKVEHGEDAAEECAAIIVEVKATSKVEDDHRLQLAAYGSIYVENARSEAQAAKRDCNALKSPELYLVYPTLGKLVRVYQHMDSFEFIHRLGCRKLCIPFDPSILNRRTQRIKLAEYSESCK